MLRRAREGCYGAGSLKDLPEAWRGAAFEPAGALFRLREPFRDGVSFLRQDIRGRMPPGPFDLILCRYLAFTYFDQVHQRRALDRIARRLRPGGALVLGTHESLPAPCDDFITCAPKLGIYRKRGARESLSQLRMKTRS